MKLNELTKKIVYVGLLSALTVLCTIVIRIPLPNNGYLHTGDIIIVIAACFLGWKYGALVGGIGSTLADVIVAPIWAPYTLVIKVLMGALVGCGYLSNGTKKYSLYIAAGLIVMGGYYLAEAILFGNWIAPVMSAVAIGIKYMVSLFVGIIISKRLKPYNL